jgi:biotin carboxyl carrier protein
MASLTFGASAVFDRIGIKEISDLQITITDQFGESASFRVEPFRFRVANHEQRITNNISTHNQISIEGRGVVDATGMGADKRDLQQSISIQPSWKELDFIYLPNANVHTLVEESTLITVSAADPKKFSSQAFGVPSALTVSKPSSRVMTALKASSSPHDIEVRIPDLGDFDEVQVIELLVKVGDKVKVDQSLITVENDKASMEIPSLHSGVLKDLNVKLGDKVREGSLIAKIENVDVVEVSENQLQQSISSNALYPLEVHIPDIGDVKDVVVLEILVKVGDIVHKDQSILMVESDKFTMEIPSTESGVVKELKVLLGDKVNEGTLVLLLDMQTGVKESSANDVKCPPINVYLPASRQYIKLTLVTEFLEIMRGVRSRSKNWHILVSGTKSVQKLMIRDLILEGGNFSELRSTSSGDLENVKDLAAILTNLEKNHLFELDGLDELVFRGGYFSDIISTSLADFQMDIMIGEGVSARAIKLDLQPFYSIFYCKDINVLPVNLLNHFSCCFTLDE